MCVDYTGLNKAYPKDPFTLPRIDQVVDSTVGCEALCFLDAYSGYHQIAMDPSNQLATSFITPFGYTSMPFGLWNAGATVTPDFVEPKSGAHHMCARINFPHI